jgi:hypothetical protein
MEMIYCASLQNSLIQIDCLPLPGNVSISMDQACTEFPLSHVHVRIFGRAL